MIVFSFLVDFVFIDYVFNIIPLSSFVNSFVEFKFNIFISTKKESAAVTTDSLSFFIFN